MADFGYSFTPGLADRFRAATNNNSQLPANATQALQILSLHLPDVLSGAAVAPDALLRGTPGTDPAAGTRAMTGGIPASSPVPAAPFPQPGPDPGPTGPPPAPGSPRVTVPQGGIPRTPIVPPTISRPGVPNVGEPIGNGGFQALMGSIFGPSGAR